MAKKKKGTLIVIGGHEDKKKNKEILQEVCRRTGSGKLVVTTVASQSPDELWEEIQRVKTAYSDLQADDVDGDDEG